MRISATHNTPAERLAIATAQATLRLHGISTRIDGNQLLARDLVKLEWVRINDYSTSALLDVAGLDSRNASIKIN